MARPKILFLEPLGGVSQPFRHSLSIIMQKAKLNIGDCFFVNLNRLVKNTYVEKKSPNGRAKQVPNEDPKVAAELRKVLANTINRIQPSQIVINCGAVLNVVAPGQTSVSNNRGSVYLFSGIHAIVFDSLFRLKDTDNGSFNLSNDCKKLSRIVHKQCRAEPRFNYTVCRTIDDCVGAEQYLQSCDLIALDVETKGTTITSIQFAGLQIRSGHGSANSGHDASRIRNFVIPFYDERKPGCAFWDTEESEIAVWRIVQRILANEVHKCGHNAAAYDSALLIKYQMPARNLFWDSYHLWNCLYPELPKSLDYVSSICVDLMTFWKEDIKGVEDEDITDEGMDNFWKYGALDVYYTILSCVFLIQLVARTEYARVNYLRQFPRQIGPCLAMSCRGIKVDYSYLNSLRDEWKRKDESNRRKLAIMVDNAEFNPKSPAQVSSLFFDVLGAKQVRVKGKGKTTNEAALKMIGDQHPLYKKFADAVLDCRETAKIISTYLFVKIRKRRFHYGLNAAGTYTERLSSGTWLWEGQNAQNIPDNLRGMFVANNGYFVFDIDLEQSDARYVAYESGDQKYISNVESGKDTHCLHAAHFFKEGYDLIYAAVKAGVEKYAHKVTGIRAITKRIVHGANYQMAAYTLYTTMGREAVVAAAKAIGITDAGRYTVDQLVKICETFLEDYHVLYPKLRPWYGKIEAQLKKTRMVTTCYGWTNVFFGDPDDAATQRSATAFLGQGGTGGCINRALDFAYWGDHENSVERLDGRSLLLLLQVHDSIVGMAPISEQGIAGVLRLIDYMQWPVTINGREMRVPAAAQIGVRWGKYLEKISIEELRNGGWRKVIEKCKKKELEIIAKYAA